MKHQPRTTRAAMTALGLAAIFVVAGETQAQTLLEVARSIAASAGRSTRQTQPTPVSVQRESQARSVSRPPAVTAQRNSAITNSTSRAPRPAQPVPVRAQHGTAVRPVAQPALRPAPRPIAVPAPRNNTSVSVNFSFQSIAPAPVVVAPHTPVVMPAPVVAPAPVVMPQPVVTLPQEMYGYAPPMQTVHPSGVVFQGVLSTRSEVAPRTAVLGDGIEVKVRKVRDDPFRADLEIRVGDFEETYKRLPVGSRISLRGWSGQLYHIDLVDVGYRARMVTIIVTR